MKSILSKLFLFTPILMVSCILHYESISIKSNESYKKCTDLKFNGYYLGKVLDANNDSAFQAIFLYKDGSIHSTSVYYDSLAIQVDLLKFPKSFGQTWGFYKIVGNDTIVSEMVWKDIPSFRAFRDSMTGICTENKITFIDTNNNFEFNFVPFHLKPDSTLNWLIKHRKYR